jgi:hypothetical protein
MAGNPHLEQLHQQHMQVKQQQHEQQIALEQHLNNERLASSLIHSAKEAIEHHQVFGPHSLHQAVKTALHNGSDPEYIRGVGQLLHHAGFPELAKAHSDAVDNW